MQNGIPNPREHSHVFLGAAHAQNERKTWAAITLTGFMMIAEIVGGSIFGSLAVVADGFHMASHAAALLIAAVAYTYARHYATDPRFAFGTGKFGDLAGFTSAIILAMIALLIGYEAVRRLIAPVPIAFAEAIPIACGGLVVNVVTAWLLSGGEHGHSHGQGQLQGHRSVHDHHDHDHGHDHHDHHDHDHGHDHHDIRTYELSFEGPVEIRTAERDLNMRAAFIHVVADAAVSVLAIVGLLSAYYFGWNWMDPLMGIIGALVIANWAYGLVRDAGGILLDVLPDKALAERLRSEIEHDGDRITDLHLWRLGPGHLGAVLSVVTQKPRSADYYRQRLGRFRNLSHVTVEVETP